MNNKQDQGYAKGTWTPTRNDTVSFTFLNDPTDISGRRDRDLTNARDRSRVQGGDNYSGNYMRLKGPWLFEGGVNIHNGEVSDFSAIRDVSNTVIYRSTDVRTLNDEQRGGFGQGIIDQRDTKGVRGTAQYTWNRHTFKGGLEWSRNYNFRDLIYIDNQLVTSLQPGLSGLSAGELAPGSSAAVISTSTTRATSTA